MSDAHPARDLHYSFVVDARGHAAYQAYLLARSLIDLGAVSPASISASFVEGADEKGRAALEDLGVATSWVRPFGHPYCNKLQGLPSLLELDADAHVLLDTDMFSLRPLEVPIADNTVAGKMADLANPPFDAAAQIFRAAGLPVTPAPASDGSSTARANFNGGLYIVPRDVLPRLAEAWPRWANWSLANADLYGKWADNIDQLSFALAVAELDVDANPLPERFNVPTHLPTGSLSAEPYFLHYHRNVDTQFFLNRTGAREVDAAIDNANAAITRWRREDLVNALYWSSRYALFPDLGSGAGSRGAVLEQKRAVTAKLMGIIRPASVVDIGGGDGMAAEGLLGGFEHVATDVSREAERVYLERNPEARFVISDVTSEVAIRADMALCLDLLIHIADPDRYRQAVTNAIASGAHATLVSGFDEKPAQPGTTTFFHEPLLDTIEADREAVAYPVDAYRGVTAYAVQRGAGTGHPRDATPSILRRAIPLASDPLTLLECVVSARREIGFFPDHLTRAIEYPWILKTIRALARSDLHVVDVGAGVNVLPLLLADDGHLVTTVDPHRSERTLADRANWNEWGYLDYGTLRPSITSLRVPYEEAEIARAADVIYSVSVIEHLPAAVRRAWLARMAEQLSTDGRLLLTVDLEPGSRRLWRLSEGVEVEPESAHGTLDTLLSEMEDVGFAIDDVADRQLLPLSRVGIAMITARRRAVPKRATSAVGPTVTVCVPAYRPYDQFVGLLESIGRQTYRNVVVNVSLDYAPGHEMPPLPDLNGTRIEFTQQPERRGWIGNVNAVLATVRTPYFVLLMHDDQLTPRYIEDAVAILEAEPDVAAVHGAVRYHGIRDGEVLGTDSIDGDRLERVHAFLYRKPHVAHVVSRGVIRSELLRHGLRFRTHRSDGMFAHDLFALEIVVHGRSVALADEFYDKFTDPEGLSRQYHGRPVEQRSEMLSDSLANLLDVLSENDFREADRLAIVTAYADWLLDVQGPWNVISDKPRSDQETFATARPAIARFVANAVLSAASPATEFRPEATTASSAQATPLRTADPVRAKVKRLGRRCLLRVPASLRPNPLFDASWYAREYPDVATGRRRPMLHFRRHGAREGRNPNALFDTRWYLKVNPDVARKSIDALDHYLVFGAREGRDPSPRFSTRGYLQLNPDVAQSGMNPLEHYLTHGRLENRVISPSSSGQTTVSAGR